MAAVSGSEQMAWEYEAGSIGGLEPSGFVAYVDDVRMTLQGASCHRAGSANARTCRSHLPALSAGAHTIEVAAYIDAGVHRIEGLRSTSIRVRLVEPAPSDASGNQELDVVTADGVRLRGEMLASGLSDPTDLALLPDGGALIAERSGRIVQCRAGVMQENPPALLPDIVTGDGRGLLALTADVDFERTRAVYAVYTATTGARLVRLIDFGRGLGAAVTLLDGLPHAPGNPTAALRIGPDRLLYLALDDGAQPARAGDMGAYEGKVLRLNRDGTTPRDQRRHSPIYAAGIHKPAGIAWQSDARIWLVAGDSSGDHLLAVVPTQTSGEGRIDFRLVLPSGFDGSGVIYYDSPAIPPFRGNLFVAGRQGRAVLRLRAGQANAGPEWLFRESIGPLRGLAVGVDGAIHALTSEALWRIAGR